jgi:hypothetical protein
VNQTFFEQRRPHGGMAYAEYETLVAAEADQPTDGLPAEDRERIEFTRLNRHRARRIAHTYRVSSELHALLRRIEAPQLWMVLTEPWCGDSAQCLPYIAAMAETTDRIELRILLRDDNLDIMDLYLTDGKRSIPLLIAFAADGRELFRWGPRPAAAQEVFAAARAEGLEKPRVLERLHLFYGRDRGRALEAEFVRLLGGPTAPAPVNEERR